MQELGPVTLFCLHAGTSCGLEAGNVPSAALWGGHCLACHCDLVGFETRVCQGSARMLFGNDSQKGIR